MLGNRYVIGIVGILLIMVIGYNAQFFISRHKKDQKGYSSQPVASRGLHAGSAPKERAGDLQSDRAVPVAAALPTAKGDRTVWKRDPFSLRADKGKPEEVTYDIKLTGIIKRDGDSHALINGKVYRVNDRVDKAVIREIRQHSIVIVAGGKQQEIMFNDYKVIKEKIQ